MKALKLTITIMALSTFIMPSTNASEHSKMNTSKNWQDHYTQIKTAKRFDDSVIGEAIDQSANFKAYKGLKESDISVSKLEKLLQSATPAGKLYAAVLISDKSHERGLEAYKKLLTDNSDVDYKSGCKVCSFKVSEIAKSLMDTGKFINFKTSRFKIKKNSQTK